MVWSLAQAGGDGILRPAGGMPADVAEGGCIGPGYITYPSTAKKRKPGHKFWMMPDGFQVPLNIAYYAPCIAATEGVVWLLRWGDIETSAGVYNWAPLIAALDYCQTQGIPLVPRIYTKSYANAVDPPTIKCVPDDIKADHTTYGGVSGSGGMRRVYIGSTWSGWGAMFDNASVNARFRTFFSAMVAAVGSHPALAGYMYDESTWGCFDGTAMPAGVTTASIDTTMRALYDYMRVAAGAKPVWPNINYLDGDGALETIYATTIALRDYCRSQGMPVSVTDTYPLSRWSRFLQPVYRDMPIAGASNVIVTIDYGSTGADDATLLQRTIANVEQTLSMGADCTVLYARGGGTSNYWLAFQAAMAAVG